MRKIAKNIDSCVPLHEIIKIAKLKLDKSQGKIWYKYQNAYKHACEVYFRAKMCVIIKKN